MNVKLAVTQSEANAIFSQHVEKRHRGFRVKSVSANPDGSFECEAEIVPPAARKPRQPKAVKPDAPTAIKKKA